MPEGKRCAFAGACFAAALTVAGRQALCSGKLPTHHARAPGHAVEPTSYIRVGHLAIVRYVGGGVGSCPRRRRLRDPVRGDDLEMDLGHGHDSLGRQGGIPAADPVPGAESRARRVAVVEPLCLLGPTADRRPAIDDLLAAVPAACVLAFRPQRLGDRHDRARGDGGRRHRRDRLLPRSRVALGRGARRRARFQLRRSDGMADAAHRPGAEPRLSAVDAAPRRPRDRPHIDRQRRAGRPRSGIPPARPRPGGAARDLSGGGPCRLASGTAGRTAPRAAPRLSAARCRGDRRRRSCRHADPDDGTPCRQLQPTRDRLHRCRWRLACTPHCC